MFLFNLPWSCLVHSVHIGPFYPLWSIRSYSVNFAPIWSTSVLLGKLCSYLVHFSPIRSTLVIFGPIWFIWSYSNHFGPFWSTSLYSVHFLCTYIMEKYRFGLRAQILNPNLLYIYVCVYIKDLKLVISKILSVAFIVATLLLSHINVAFETISVWLNLSEVFLNKKVVNIQMLSLG